MMMLPNHPDRIFRFPLSTTQRYLNETLTVTFIAASFNTHCQPVDHRSADEVDRLNDSLRRGYNGLATD